MASFPDCGKWLEFKTMSSGSVSRLGQVVRFPDCGKWLGFQTGASGYATILFRAINATIDSQLLQEDLTALENWENR